MDSDQITEVLLSLLNFSCRIKKIKELISFHTDPRKLPNTVSSFWMAFFKHNTESERNFSCKSESRLERYVATCGAGQLSSGSTTLPLASPGTLRATSSIILKEHLGSSQILPWLHLLSPPTTSQDSHLFLGHTQ